MGLRPLQMPKYVYSNSAGIDFSRQNLTCTDVRFWRLKSIPAGPQFKQHFPKRRAGRRTDNRVGVFRALCKGAGL